MRCPYCFDRLAGRARVCAECGTAVHEECFAEHGRCVVLGCGAGRTVKPSFRLAARQATPRFSLTRVLAIALVTTMVAVPTAMSLGIGTGRCGSRATRLLSDCETIKGAIATFKRDRGRFPASIAELWELSTVHANGRTGPYITPCPRDPWGRRYLLAYDGDHPVVSVAATDEPDGQIDLSTGD